MRKKKHKYFSDALREASGGKEELDWEDAELGLREAVEPWINLARERRGSVDDSDDVSQLYREGIFQYDVQKYDLKKALLSALGLEEGADLQTRERYSSEQIDNQHLVARRSETHRGHRSHALLSAPAGQFTSASIGTAEKEGKGGRRLSSCRVSSTRKRGSHSSWVSIILVARELELTETLLAASCTFGSSWITFFESSRRRERRKCSSSRCGVCLCLCLCLFLLSRRSLL